MNADERRGFLGALRLVSREVDRQLETGRGSLRPVRALVQSEMMRILRSGGKRSRAILRLSVEEPDGEGEEIASLEIDTTGDLPPEILADIYLVKFLDSSGPRIERLSRRVSEFLRGR